MVTGLETTRTATGLMRVQMLGAIHNTTVLDAPTPILMGIQIRLPDGPAPPIVSVLTPSLTTQHSGAMKTTMASEATQTAINPMSAQTTQALQRLTESVAPTEMAMAIPTRATRSLMMQRNGPTEMAITEATTQAATTPTLSQTTPVNGRTAMAMATGTIQVATTAMLSRPTRHNGAMRTAMATAITPTETSGICALLTTVNPRLNSAVDAPIQTLTA